jgi:hypothetical protein
VAAALLTVIVSTTQPTGALAALPILAGQAGAEAAIPHETVPMPASLPAVTSVARALDDPAREPEPTPVLLAPAPATPAALPKAPAARAAPARPSRPRVVRAAVRPARLWAQLRAGLTVTGSATWYFGTSGYAGVAHVAMPGARYLPRGRSAPRARICAGGRCTIVAVVDACGCRAGTRGARLVDVSVTTLRRLGLDPRRGVYQVRVTLVTP